MDSRIRTLAYLFGMAAGSAVMLQLIINAQPGLEPSPQKTQRPPRTKPYVKTGDKLLVMRAASK